MTESLYVTQGEIVRRMGVGINSGNKAVQKMRKHPQFPPKTIGGKYYWPAVRDFLEIWNNRTIAAPGISAGQETTNGQTTTTGRRRPSLEATKEWLGSRMAVPSGSRGERLQTIDAPDRRVHERPDRS